MPRLRVVRLISPRAIRLRLTLPRAQCCVQLSPVHGDVAASQARADALLARLDTTTGVHIVLLPELAFTGYTFRDAAHVRPLAERPVRGGPTFDWCAALAARLNSYVACGYVEAASGGDGALLYNSQMVVSPAGELAAHHRKHHLYATDKTWATAGDGWTVVRLASLRVLVSLGICMDINQWEFEAPWDAYEWANAAREGRAGLLLFSSAWCDRSPDDPPEYVPPPVSAPQTLSYWAARLQPLLRRGGASDAHRRVHFVCADRVGKEGTTNFCGCSCVMALGPRVDGDDDAKDALASDDDFDDQARAATAPSLLGALDTTREGLLLRDVDVPTDDDDDAPAEPE